MCIYVFQMAFTVCSRYVLSLAIALSLVVLSDSMSIHSTRTTRNAHSSTDDYYPSTAKRTRSAPSEVSSVIMPGRCEDFEVFNFCYACGRDIDSRPLFINCCNMDSETITFCSTWLRQSE